MVPVQWCAAISRAQNQSDRIADVRRTAGGRDYLRAVQCSRCEAASWASVADGKPVAIKKQTRRSVSLVLCLGIFFIFFTLFDGKLKSNFRGSEGVKEQSMIQTFFLLLYMKLNYCNLNIFFCHLRIHLLSLKVIFFYIHIDKIRILYIGSM